MSSEGQLKRSENDAFGWGESDRDDWRKNGVILLEPNQNIYSDEDILEMQHLADQLPYEWVEVGDAGEPNAVEVGRFMTDVEAPERVNRPLSDQILAIIVQAPQMCAFKALLNVNELHIRRMQVNRIHEAGFVGYHLDTDSNPDYLAAVIFQFGDDFEGGEYVVYDQEKVKNSISPPQFSMIISDCRFPHEVKPVRSGIRTSLVFFLSQNGGVNRRAL